MPSLDIENGLSYTLRILEEGFLRQVFYCGGIGENS
jgi:hypothetical protein